MSLTKKDFIAIGTILKQIKSLKVKDINLFIQYFKAKNPKFDEVKFKEYLLK